MDDHKSGRKNSTDRNDSKYDDELKERLEELIKEGKEVEATSSDVNIYERPSYLDEERFLSAQKVVADLSVNLIYSSMAGLILLVQTESILIPLLKTGRSRTIPDLFDRYHLTIKSMFAIYLTKFYECETEGWKHLNMIRGMHKRIHQIMVSNFTDERKQHEGDANLWVNQYDMALTSFAFVGLLLLEPKRSGVHNVNEGVLSQLAYYWRLISYYFGIEERFNIFVYHDDIEKQFAYMQLLLDHFKSILNESRPEVGVRMAQGIVCAFEDLSYRLLSFDIFDHGWSPVISMTGLKEPKPLTFAGRLKALTVRFAFSTLFKNKKIHGILNRAYLWRYREFCKQSDGIRKKLVEKYPHITYESYEGMATVTK